MARYEVSAVRIDGGFRFDLTRSGIFRQAKAVIPFAEWDAEMHPAVGLLKFLADHEAVTDRDGRACIDDDTVACMPSTETTMLGLPLRCPYSLHLEAVGALTDPAFKVRASWISREGAPAAGLRQQGALLQSVVDRFLLVEPLYSVLVEIGRLNVLPPAKDLASLDRRMVQFERFKMALATATGDARADAYLGRLTIHHVTGLAIEPRAGGDDFFDPVLYGDAPPPVLSPEHEESPISRQPLLGGEHAQKFQEILFPRQGSRSHYRFSEGVYAVLDRPVAAALGVVERINASDAKTRAAFRADPRSFLTEEIEKAGGSGDVVCDGTVMHAAMDYGERVLGIEEWDGTRLSFKIPVFRKWFPDEDVGGGGDDVFTIQIPGSVQPLIVRQTELAALQVVVDAAGAGLPGDVAFNGRSYPLTVELEDTLAKLAGPLKAGAMLKSVSRDKRKLLVLRAAENEEDLVFNARLRDPDGVLSAISSDELLVSKPMPHQVDGIAWLRHAFLSGMPGVLLADDMGLGKTFQVLAFLHWLQRNAGSEKRPILVVAPKKLLEVWREEVSRHLGAEGLGRPVLVYDEHVSRLKVANGKDGELGRHTLDVGVLRAVDWVLTTYETLRDYHFSFGAVRFRVAIYDEAQKMKSMVSLINNAAKCQQPDFTILMTGTPIENSVMDLWTLLDIAWPGFIPSSAKEFSEAYGEKVSAEHLAELKTRLIEPVIIDARPCPPIMLRRFKADILIGLPKKTVKVWRETMASEQAKAYNLTVAEHASRSTSALQAIQALRTVAFHPNLRAPTSKVEHATIIAESARFRSLFTILDQAHVADERVLVFVDLRRGQEVLGTLIRHRYRMPNRPPVINGDTSTQLLSKIKTEFQRGSGFEVLLLGPRSAGFGLTLTAANHVVHMNRWWNPAVEDQCSDRVYRLGQTRDVFIHLPIAVHPDLGDASFDMVLNSMLEEKRGLSRDIVVPTAMTEADFDRMYAATIESVPPRSS